MRTKGYNNRRGTYLLTIDDKRLVNHNDDNWLIFVVFYMMMQLNKSYVDICKGVLVPSIGILELSSMYRVLALL